MEVKICEINHVLLDGVYRVCKVVNRHLVIVLKNVCIEFANMLINCD